MKWIYDILRRSGYYAEMPARDYQFFWYETNEKGERVLVKSERSVKKAYVRFVNRTSRPIEIWWRDYEGYRVLYTTMMPNTVYNLDTFISHPWEFTDAYTRERYVINNKDIFRAPECIANMPYRTTWYISIGVRSLVDTVLMSIATKITNVNDVDTLGLPAQLAIKLKNLVGVLRTPHNELISD